MTQTLRFLLTAVGLFAMAFLVVSVPAGGPEPDEKNSDTGDSPPMVREIEDQDADDAIPDDIVDSAFDRFVDLKFVRDALAAKNVSDLTDAALLLADGERRLLRPHRAVPSKILLEKALRLAVEKNDKDSLDRLGRAAKNLGLKEFQARVDEMTLLAGKSRKGALSIPLNISVDPLDAAQNEVLQNYLEMLREAIPAGNKGVLEAMAEGLEDDIFFEDATRKGLLKYVKDQLKVMPEPIAGGEDPEVLGKLLGSSRGADSEDTKGDVPQQVSGAFLAGNGRATGANARVVAYCQRQYPRSVTVPPSAGECATLNREALKYAGCKTRGGSDYPGSGDYVWGALVRVVRRNQNLTGAVRPGDLLQFRNAWFRKPNGGSWTCLHHSAVVRSVSASGRVVTVWEQGNKKDKNGKVLQHKPMTINTYDFAHLQSGTQNHTNPDLRRSGDGWVRIYTGIPNSGISFTVVNQSGRTATYWVNNVRNTLASGKTVKHYMGSNIPSFKYSYTVRRTSGGIYIEDSKIIAVPRAYDGTRFVLKANGLQS